jgi:hypothetical protein
MPGILHEVKVGAAKLPIGGFLRSAINENAIFPITNRRRTPATTAKRISAVDIR